MNTTFHEGQIMENKNFLFGPVYGHKGDFRGYRVIVRLKIIKRNKDVMDRIREQRRQEKEMKALERIKLSEEEDRLRAEGLSEIEISEVLVHNIEEIKKQKETQNVRPEIKFLFDKKVFHQNLNQ